MIIVVLCVSLLVLISIKYILHVQNIDNYLRDVKTLPRIPFIGNYIFFMGKSFQVLYEEIHEVILRSGTPFKMQVGPIFYVILTQPEDMKTILMSQHCLDRPWNYDLLHKPYSLAGLRSGKEWKPIRKLMNPMFNLKKLQSFIPIMNEKAGNFVHELEKEVDQPQFDVMHYFSVCTLDSLCGTIMGIDIKAQPNKGMDFLSSLEGLYKTYTTRFGTLWTHLDFLYQWTNLYQTEKQQMADMRKLTNIVIDAKTNAYLSTNNNVSQDEFGDEQNKSDFPLIPLYVEGKLSEELVKQQIDVILIAGHETTATTMAFAILMLAMNPNIQEQVFNELHTIHDTQSQETNSETMQKYELLDRVIKETMRLYPSVFVFQRTTTTDIQLKDCVLPKGVTVTVPVYTMHRRRDIWGDDAEQFNPDHFLPEKVQARHPFAFLPFSSGTRNCIGYQYAMLTMRVMLSAVLRQYKFSTDLTMNDLKPKFDVTLRLTNMVTVERRKW